MDFVPEFTRPLSDEVLIFALLMALLFLVPQIARKLKIPGIVGLILAGAVVGPSVLNLIAHDPDAFPPGFMGLLGTAGMMYLMFQAGVSIDLGRFRKMKGRSVGFGLMSFSIPLVGTVLIAHLLLDFSLPASFLLGAIIGSHTLIAFPIAQKLGLMKNDAVTMAMGGTLVTDTLSLSVLAVVVAATAGDAGVVDWLLFISLVGLFVFGVVWGLPRLGYHFFRTIQNRPEIEFGFLLTVLFTTAWLAELVGLAPIIGAFIGGLAMNRLVPDQSTMMQRVKFVGETLFIPFFMIYVGLLIDVQALVEGVDVWLFAAKLVGMLFVGKLIAAKISQKLFDYDSLSGWVTYGLTIPQAAATLAVTLVGIETGVFDAAISDQVLNAVVVLILISCIIGTAIVESVGKKLARKKEATPPDESGLPERILVPVANPETADDLLDLAFLMRHPESTEPIFPLVVVSDGKNQEQRVRQERERLDYAVEKGADAEIPVTPLTRIAINPAQGITRAAREEQASVIILGWSGRVSRRQKIFGTVLDHLLGTTDEMIFVNRITQPLNTVGEVVFAIPPFAERSPGFFEVISEVKLLASRMEADLRVVCLERHLEHDRRFVDAADPEMEADFESISDWDGLEDKLDEVVREDTMIVSLSARPKTPAWFPELDDMPQSIAARYPDNTFSVVFLPGGPR